MKDGLNVAIKELIQSDPVLRKKIKVVFLDDGGDQNVAQENARKLLYEHGAQILVGCVGERTCTVVDQIARTAQVPIIGAINSNDALCKQGAAAYCLHSSYIDEAKVIGEHLRTLGINRLRLWVSQEYYSYQLRVADQFKSQGIGTEIVKFTGLSSALPPLQRSVEQSGIANILLLSADDAEMAVRFIRDKYPQSMVGAFSSIEPYRWLPKAKGAAVGVFLTHSIPDPDIAKLNLVRRYQLAMMKYSEFNLPFDHIQLEMYLAGKLLGALFQRGNFSGKAIASSLLRLAVPVDEFVISFGETGHMLQAPINLSVVGRNGQLQQ